MYSPGPEKAHSCVDGELRNPRTTPADPKMVPNKWVLGCYTHDCLSVHPILPFVLPGGRAQSSAPGRRRCSGT